MCLFRGRDRNKREKERWVIAGLGNVGPEYQGSRHNCGFMVLDRLAAGADIPVEKKKFKGYIGEGVIEGKNVVLVKPATFMNLSGQCISQVLSWYKVPEDRLIIIYDDSDLEPGQIRVRARGSAGTHNGMKSVLEFTEGDEFPRVRVGIGRHPAQMDMVSFVLGHFSPQELEKVGPSLDEAADAVRAILRDGCDKAMNKYNTRK